jgi:hypothetical protein
VTYYFKENGNIDRMPFIILKIFFENLKMLQTIQKTHFS